MGDFLPVTSRGSARPPSRMTRADEYLHLFDERERLRAELAPIERRLNELAESFALDPTGGSRLPRSGLRIVATSGVTLSRGGRDHG